MRFSFSRRPAAQRPSRRRPLKRRHLGFDCLEDRRLLTGGTLSTPGTFLTVDTGGTDTTNSGANAGGTAKAVSMDGSGDAVVAWSQKQSNGNWNLMFEPYTNTGGTLSAGNEVTVASNVFGANHGTAPPRIQAARAADGQFVVVWETNSLSGSYSDNYTTYAQVFSSSGTASGNPLVVGGKGSHFLISVAMNNNGFDVFYGAYSGGRTNGTWTSTVERYSSTGKAVGSAINVTGTNDHTSGSIAMDTNSDFVVAWNQESASPTGQPLFTIEAEPCNSAGAATAGGAIAVSGSPASGVFGGSVAMDATTGNFVAPWGAMVPAPNGAASAGDLYANQYTLGGAPVQPTITVATVTYASVVGPNNGVTYYYPTSGVADDSIGVAALPGGAFDLSWTNVYDTITSDPSTPSGLAATAHRDIYAAAYGSSGTLVQPVIQVTSDGTSTGSSVALDGNNDLLAVWQDAAPNASTGNVEGEFYLDPPSTATSSPAASSPAAAPAASGSTTAVTDAVFAAYGSMRRHAGLSDEG